MPPMMFPTSTDEVLTPAQIGALSGLEFLQGIADGRLPAPPIAQTLKFSLTEVSLGRVAFQAKPDISAMNPIGTVHGGWFGTLLDSCMACAVQSTLPRGKGYTSLEYKVSLIRPLYADGELVEAVGTVTHVGRRTGIATGEIRGVGSGKLYATGTTTCLILELPTGG